MIDHKGRKILIAEDELFLRDLYVEILRNEGYEVSAAENGEVAFAAITNKIFDLILLDIIMPEMDGLQVLQSLKNVGENETFGHIVLLTNLGNDIVISKALEYGVRGFMLKSDYTPDEILTEVKNHLSAILGG